MLATEADHARAGRAPRRGRRRLGPGRPRPRPGRRGDRGATSPATARSPPRRSARPRPAAPRPSTPSPRTTPPPAWRPAERIDVALIAADQLSGLITAAALVRPDKELAGVQVKSVRKRYREGAFARGVHRAVDRALRRSSGSSSTTSWPSGSRRCRASPPSSASRSRAWSRTTDRARLRAPRARPTRSSAAAWASCDERPSRPRRPCCSRGPLRLEPGQELHPRGAGRAEFAAGRYERAAELFREIVSRRARLTTTPTTRWRGLWPCGRGEEARGHLRLARALRPPAATPALEGVD